MQQIFGLCTLAIFALVGACTPVGPGPADGATKADAQTSQDSAADDAFSSSDLGAPDLSQPGDVLTAQDVQAAADAGVADSTVVDGAPMLDALAQDRVAQPDSARQDGAPQDGAPQDGGSIHDTAMDDGSPDVSVDPCLVLDCDLVASCVLDNGPPHCVCPVGYDDSLGNGTVCTDHDGCDPNPCFAGVDCTDAIAPATGYSCAECPPGYDGDGEQCTDHNSCEPNPCFAGVECSDATAPETGYSCAGCPAGYDGDGESCTDHNACDPSPCFPGVDCTDATAPETGYSCADCPAGYDGDGESCTDHNACAPNPCFADVDCIDAEAPATGYSCGDCPVGYSGDGETCLDHNACDPNPCFTGVTCTDALAPATGYTCAACPLGFVGDGEICDPLLSCHTDPGVCAEEATCQDIGFGDMRCVCGSGFAGDGASCTDVDECDLGTFTCSADRVCQNNHGGYDCVCAPGYWGDEFMCSLLQACDVDADLCVSHSTCQQTPEGYACICDPGTVGDGSSGCESTGLSMGFTATRYGSYPGECTAGPRLRKYSEGLQTTFDGEWIDVRLDQATLYQDAGCSQALTHIQAPVGVMELEFFTYTDATYTTETLAAENQLLGTATTLLRSGGIRPEALDLSLTPTTGITGRTITGEIQLLSPAGHPMVSFDAEQPIELSSPGEVRLNVSGGYTNPHSANFRQFSSGQVFRFVADSAGDHTIEVVDVNGVLTPASLVVTFTDPVPDYITFSQNNYASTSSTCTSVRINVYDEDDYAAPVADDETITLASTADRVYFYPGSNCSGSISQVTVPAGEWYVSFYMRTSRTGTHTLTATHTSLGLDTATYTVSSSSNCPPTSCIPSGQYNCGSCNYCCSGVCMGSSCY